MKLWILGKNGFVGHTLINHARKRGIETVATSSKEVDIRKLDQIERYAEENEITHLINAAAYTHVDAAEQHCKLAYSINADGPKNLGIAARRLKAALVHLSTDYVFDGAEQHPYREDDPCRPLSVYGHSKWLGEEKLLTELPWACIVRTSWVFGLGGKNFISNLVHLLKNTITLDVISDQKSSPTYCPDLCDALLFLLNHSGIFHFANRGTYSRFELAQMVMREVKMPIICKDIHPISAQTAALAARRPAYSVLNTQKITTAMHRPPRSWDEVLQEWLSHAT
jgi:dTDP-4-dehydrorhamnose reductase